MKNWSIESPHTTTLPPTHEITDDFNEDTASLFEEQTVPTTTKITPTKTVITENAAKTPVDSVSESSLIVHPELAKLLIHPKDDNSYKDAPKVPGQPASGATPPNSIEYISSVVITVYDVQAAMERRMKEQSTSAMNYQGEYNIHGTTGYPPLQSQVTTSQYISAPSTAHCYPLHHNDQSTTSGFNQQYGIISAGGGNQTAAAAIMDARQLNTAMGSATQFTNSHLVHEGPSLYEPPHLSHLPPHTGNHHPIPTAGRDAAHLSHSTHNATHYGTQLSHPSINTAMQPSATGSTGTGMQLDPHTVNNHGIVMQTAGLMLQHTVAGTQLDQPHQAMMHHHQTGTVAGMYSDHPSTNTALQQRHTLQVAGGVRHHGSGSSNTAAIPATAQYQHHSMYQSTTLPPLEHNHHQMIDNSYHTHHQQQQHSVPPPRLSHPQPTTIGSYSATAAYTGNPTPPTHHLLNINEDMSYHEGDTQAAVQRLLAMS